MNDLNIKYIWAQNLRALATFGCIVLHVTANLVHEYGNISYVYWWFGNIIESSTRFCVPIFLMLTGALMFQKEYFFIDFIKKRFIRILLPFIFWSTVYLCLDINVRIGELNFFEYFLIKFRDGSYFHLWYVYEIIGIYLIFPVYSKWIKNCDSKEILYFLCIWFLLIVMNIPFCKKFIPNINLTYFSGYIGYPILGYYLMENSSKYKKIAIPFIIIGISITMFGTYFLSNWKGYIHEAFYEFLSPNVLMTSIGVFIIGTNC